MYKKLITATILTFSTLLPFAQQGSPSIAQSDKGVFGSPVMPGPNGTYIYTADTNGRMRRPTPANVYTLYKETGSGFKQVATLSFPSSTAELEKTPRQRPASKYPDPPKAPLRKRSLHPAKSRSPRYVRPV